MENNIIVTPFFERKFKRIAKKYPALYDEIKEFEKEILLNPKSGIDLGSNIYKFRLANKNKNKGKSSGFRIITFLIEEVENYFEINLITIYDKSEEANITKNDILKIIQSIFD